MSPFTSQQAADVSEIQKGCYLRWVSKTLSFQGSNTPRHYYLLGLLTDAVHSLLQSLRWGLHRTPWVALEEDKKALSCSSFVFALPHSVATTSLTYSNVRVGRADIGRRERGGLIWYAY